MSEYVDRDCAGCGATVSIARAAVSVMGRDWLPRCAACAHAVSLTGQVLPPSAALYDDPSTVRIRTTFAMVTWLSRAWGIRLGLLIEALKVVGVADDAVTGPERKWLAGVLDERDAL